MSKVNLFRTFIFLTVIVSVTGGALISWRFVDPALISTAIRQTVLKVHIVSSVTFLVILGMMASDHFVPHIQKGVRKARKSGISLLFIIGLMIISGFALQITSSIWLLEFNYWTHVLTGLFFYGIFVIHRFRVAQTNALRIHLGWVAVVLLSLIPLFDSSKSANNSEDEFFLGDTSSEVEKSFTASLLLMGSELSVQFTGADNFKLFDEVATQSKNLEDEISHYKMNSSVGKLNTNTISSVRLSEQALLMYRHAQQVKFESNGAFDPEYSNEFSPISHKPCFALVNQTLEKKCEQSQLDYGAIGKGSALDLAMSILIPSAKCIALNFAGQIAFDYSDESCFKPETFTFRDVPGLIKVDRKSGSISTSGNFGKRVSGEDGHIYDPTKGELILHSYAVVVYHEIAAYADAWSTAFFVLGPDDAFKLARKKNINVIFVFSDGTYSTFGNVLDFMPSL